MKRVSQRAARPVASRLSRLIRIQSDDGELTEARDRSPGAARTSDEGIGFKVDGGSVWQAAKLAAARIKHLEGKCKIDID